MHKREQLGDVWTLETPLEEQASASLSAISETALAGHKKNQKYLEKVFEEKWKHIKSKLQAEGSTWYVWWMDGVRNHIALSRAKHGW